MRMLSSERSQNHAVLEVQIRRNPVPDIGVKNRSWSLQKVHAKRRKKFFIYNFRIFLKDL